MSLKESGEPSIHLSGAATWWSFVSTPSDCTHVFSGTLGDASFPLGSVNSIAYFVSVSVGSKRDSVQTVAVSLTGHGCDFPVSLKSTVALQNTGSILACTVQLSTTYDAMNLQRTGTQKIHITFEWIMSTRLLKLRCDFRVKKIATNLTKLQKYIFVFKFENSTKINWKLNRGKRKSINAHREVHYLLSSPNGTITRRFPGRICTSLLSPLCISLNTSGEPSIQLFRMVFCWDLSTAYSACVTHIFSGTEDDARLPPGLVKMIAVFPSVAVGRKRDCFQTVAVSLLGGGFGFPGTLKSTKALQNIGSIVACTFQLFEKYAVYLQMTWETRVLLPVKSTHVYCEYTRTINVYICACLLFVEENHAKQMAHARWKQQIAK